MSRAALLINQLESFNIQESIADVIVIENQYYAWDSSQVDYIECDEDRARKILSTEITDEELREKFELFSRSPEQRKKSIERKIGRAENRLRRATARKNRATARQNRATEREARESDRIDRLKSRHSKLSSS